MLVFNQGFVAGTKIIISVSSNQTDYNLYNVLRDTYGWDEVNAVDVDITIETGVLIDSSIDTVAAFSTGSLSPGSQIKLINDGQIIGAGGPGGAGGSASCPSTCTAGVDGTDGGDAIDSEVDITIDNTNGDIFGGGGGGGGGGSILVDLGGGGADLSQGGGGGGGGAGDLNGPGGAKGTATSCALNHIGSVAATAGTTVGGIGGDGGDILDVPDTNPGLLDGDGGDGGGYGEDGNTGGSPFSAFCQAAGGAKGLAGKAVELNSNNITWLGGNNSTQVKGAVS